VAPIIDGTGLLSDAGVGVAAGVGVGVASGADQGSVGGGNCPGAPALASGSVGSVVIAHPTPLDVLPAP